MKHTLLILLFFASNALAIENTSYICTNGALQRIIEIQYPEGTAIPCAVVYTRDGESTTLWQAMNENGYCEEKATGFVDKQSSWGWQCQQSTSPEQQATITDREVLQATADNLAAEAVVEEQSPDAEAASRQATEDTQAP
jgi:hypothetical protein